MVDDIGKAGDVMRSRIEAVGLVFTLCALAAPGARAERGSVDVQKTRMTPEQEAIQKYDNGLKHRDKAVEAQEKAARASKDKDRKKQQKKARKEYEKAAKDFRSAIEANSQLFQAHSDLGFVLRKLGDFEAALAAYDTALGIQPNYGAAIAYQAEAYLGLGRTADVKDAYQRLFRGDPKLAATLMDAMKQWVEERTAAPGDFDAGDVEAFATWVAERDTLAQQTASGSSGGRGW